MAPSSSGITELWREAASGPAEFYGVDLATTVGIHNSDTGGVLSVDFDRTGGAADTARLVLADSAVNDAIVVSAVENLVVTSTIGTVAPTTSNTAKITVDAAQTIVFLGDKGLVTAVTSAHVTMIDASVMTGALGIVFGTTGSAGLSIRGGKGGDTFVINETSGVAPDNFCGNGADTVTI